MQTETATISIDRSADVVWGLVGEFGGLDTWMAGVDECRLVGDVRIVHTMGLEIEEKLIDRDPSARTITYSIVGGGAPVSEHSATITVTPTGDDASDVTWAVSTEPDDAAGFMRDVYQGALAHLKRHVEG